MVLRGNHKSSHSGPNSDVLDKCISKDIDHGWALSHHNGISTKNQKYRGCDPRGCRPIINKRERVALYQNTCDPWLLIPIPLRHFVKQPGQTWITTIMLLWLLPAQDSTHDLINTKQIANKTNPYWKNRPGRSLLLDTRKCENCVNMNCNNRRASLYLPDVTLWHHTHTRIIYNW